MQTYILDIIMSDLGKYYLDHTYVDKVWEHWCQSNSNRSYFTNYHSNPRNYSSRMFEDWLFKQGVSVVRKDKLYYLKFSDEQTCILMAMKYG